VADLGVPGLHFHDLRHTGNLLAAMTGASLRDLMTRMGHDSMRAALICTHATQGGDRRIAEGIEAIITGAPVGERIIQEAAGGNRADGRRREVPRAG
jgi:hypothetical protein